MRTTQTPGTRASRLFDLFSRDVGQRGGNVVGSPGRDAGWGWVGSTVSVGGTSQDGCGRFAAHEISLGTGVYRNLIRENKVAQMYSSIQTSQAAGMQTLDQCLTEMVRRNQISIPEARNRAVNKDLFGG